MGDPLKRNQRNLRIPDETWEYLCSLASGNHRSKVLCKIIEEHRVRTASKVKPPKPAEPDLSWERFVPAERVVDPLRKSVFQLL